MLFVAHAKVMVTATQLKHIGGEFKLKNSESRAHNLIYNCIIFSLKKLSYFTGCLYMLLHTRMAAGMIVFYYFVYLLLIQLSCLL